MKTSFVFLAFLKLTFLVLFFLSQNIHSKGNLKVLWARTPQQTVIFYRKTFCAIVYNIIQNIYVFLMAFLEKGRLHA